MNHRSEMTLWDIQLKLSAITGDSRKADLLLAPLQWYISTGRCTGEFACKFGKLTARQITTVAKRLAKFTGFEPYDEPLASVLEYLA